MSNGSLYPVLSFVDLSVSLSFSIRIYSSIYKFSVTHSAKHPVPVGSVFVPAGDVGHYNLC